MIFQTKKKCSKQIDKRFEKTPWTNDTSFSFRGRVLSHLYRMGRNTLYRYRSNSNTSIVAWTKLLWYNGQIRISVRHAFSLSTIPISYSHDRYFAELIFCIVFSAILFFPCIVGSRASLLKTNKGTSIVIRWFYADTKNLIGRFH